MSVPVHSRRLLFAALALVSCAKPQVLLVVERTATSQQLLLLACDSCQWTQVFEDGSGSMKRSVGLYFDEPTLALTLRLQRPDAACVELQVTYSGTAEELALQLPSDPTLPVECTSPNCPVLGSCGVRLIGASCDSTSCADGCCDAAGQCWVARDAGHCGPVGGKCRDCSGAGCADDLGICANECLPTGQGCQTSCCGNLATGKSVGCISNRCATCKTHGESCASEPCCNGLACNKMATGDNLCGAPGAIALGGACSTGDLCTKGSCTSGVCCLATGEVCSGSGGCCNGDTCWDGSAREDWTSSPRCQDQRYCFSWYSDCSPDSNDCCSPYHCVWQYSLPDSEVFECDQ
jgi:hypothetical protein